MKHASLEIAYSVRPVLNGTCTERNPLFSRKLSLYQGCLIQLEVLGLKSARNGNKYCPLRFRDRHILVCLMRLENSRKLEFCAIKDSRARN